MVVHGELDVVAFTKFGERFCKAIMSDVSDEYQPKKEQARHEAFTARRSGHKGATRRMIQPG
jgi:hypothetical protein